MELLTLGERNEALLQSVSIIILVQPLLLLSL